MSTEKYIQSDHIRIFPYSVDRSADPFGKYLNEHNLRNMMRHITDYDSFFINIKDVSDLYSSVDTQENTGNVYKRVEFFIAGHYVDFVITLGDPEIQSNKELNEFWLTSNIYAEVEHYDEGAQYIEEFKIPANVEYSRLYASDENQEFRGVRFFTVPSDEAQNKPVRYTHKKSANNEDIDRNTVVTGFKLFNPILSLSDLSSLSRSDMLTEEFDEMMNRMVPAEARIRFLRDTLDPLVWENF